MEDPLKMPKLVITKFSPRSLNRNSTWDQIKASLNKASKTRKSTNKIKISQNQDSEIDEDLVQNHVLNKKSDMKEMVLTPLTISKIVDISKKYLPEERLTGDSNNDLTIMSNKNTNRELKNTKSQRKIRRSELNKGYDFSINSYQSKEGKRSNSENKKKKINISSLEVKKHFYFKLEINSWIQFFFE